MRLFGLILFACQVLPAQTPVFEVASIRPGAPFSMQLMRSGGIGMKIEAPRVTIRSWSLSDLIAAAYGVRTDQISAPDWVGAQRFDIQANMPPEATAAQVPQMLQTLLADRFKMVAHKTQKAMSVYALTVGKNGHKLQESAATDARPSGCTVDAGSHRICHRMTMEDLAKLLTQLSRMYAAMPPGQMTWGIDQPAVDLTGLKGTWDFTLDYGPGSEETGGGPVMDAIAKLGLRLEAQKHPSDYIVIDSMEKAPTAN